MRLRDVLTLLLLGLGLGCQAITDPGVEYVECFPSADGQYVEKFDEIALQPPGAERCWQTDNVRQPARINADGEDLIIHPYAEVGARWGETAQAPFFFQTLTGDFLAVTQVEAVSTNSPRCLAEHDAAGLAIRRQDPFSWATWLVRPQLGAPPPDECLDADEPLAQAQAESLGFEPELAETVSDVGSDAEAYIALCRADQILNFYYQASAKRAADPFENFKLLTSLDVGRAALDVGATTTAEQGTRANPEGHFPWLVLLDFSRTPLNDGCEGAFADFAFPEPE